MPSPYIGEGGRIRLSPLAAAVASSKSGGPNTSDRGGNSPSANRSSANPNVKGTQPKLPPGVTEEQVAEAKAKAENGDQDAINWLAGIAGIGVGSAGVAAGKALHDAIRNKRAARGPNNMGADNIAVDAATPNATTAVAKRAPKTTAVVPHVIPVQEEVIARPVADLPNPVKRVGAGSTIKLKDATRAVRMLK